jgi:hypothetical protein
MVVHELQRRRCQEEALLCYQRPFDASQSTIFVNITIINMHAIIPHQQKIGRDGAMIYPGNGSKRDVSLKYNTAWVKLTKAN